MSQFTCTRCGQTHDLSKITLGANTPVQWEQLSKDEKTGSLLSDDQCVIQLKTETHYFLRGCLEIPIKNSTSFFTWGVWVSLSHGNFKELAENWDNPDRVRLGPHFGWLCTRIPDYPETVYLKTQVHHRKPGLRPLIELEKTDHALAVHQREGIAQDVLEAIVVKALHFE